MNKTKKIVKWSLFFQVIALVVSGCTKLLGFEPTPTSTPRPVWLTNLLENPVCAPPCWENITPGSTTSDEAISILSQKSKIENFRKNKEPGSGTTSLYWSFTGNIGFGSIDMDQEDRVNNITLSVPSEHIFTLQEFEQIFGEFSHIEIMACRGEFNFLDCYINFIVLEKGIAADCTLEVKPRKRNQVEVNPDQKIWDIHLFIPGKNGYESMYSEIWQPTLIKWQGYGRYDVPDNY